jgi:hypothetical protein
VITRRMLGPNSSVKRTEPDLSNGTGSSFRQRSSFTAKSPSQTSHGNSGSIPASDAPVNQACFLVPASPRVNRRPPGGLVDVSGLEVDFHHVAVSVDTGHPGVVEFDENVHGGLMVLLSPAQSNGPLSSGVGTMDYRQTEPGQ